MRPDVIAQAAGGHGYGALPLAQEAVGGREAVAPRKLALVESAGPGVAGPGVAGPGVAELRRGGLELAEVEFAVIDLETTGWSPRAAAITEVAAVRVRGGGRRGEFAS
ncbi:MAG TPA: hypothetical protein VMA97_14025, partial [Streptosporangiaceae bacterium]|nr:hypothetical protein [Streptosporangiaceae bacterium]